MPRAQGSAGLDDLVRRAGFAERSTRWCAQMLRALCIAPLNALPARIIAALRAFSRRSVRARPPYHEPDKSVVPCHERCYGRAGLNWSGESEAADLLADFRIMLGAWRNSLIC